ncbi:MAG: helix-turn-helix transcriptional regulator [Candidatus Lokiarchaeota archaeon]|nr:helix-turn-helix transcriptional regulator [Candidatus Lokiarchaeota archaeon]
MDINIKELLNKSKLTIEEIEEFKDLANKTDKKVSHSRAYKTMMNPTRRDLLQFIGYEIKTIPELMNKFNLSNDQVNYHLAMLKQGLYVISSKEGWKCSPLGLGFLENTILKE